jgi:hypothetical protein
LDFPLVVIELVHQFTTGEMVLARLVIIATTSLAISL